MTHRKSMQVSVEDILRAHGRLDDFKAAFEDDGEFFLKLRKDGHDDLSIEKVGPDRVAVAHTFVQYGDVMFDPEIVFSYHPEFPDAHWLPVEITQSPMGVYRSKFFKRNGREMVDLRFDSAVSPLVQAWAKNLRWQNWAQAEVA